MSSKNVLFLVMASFLFGFVILPWLMDIEKERYTKQLETETNEFLEKVVEEYPRKLFDSMYFVESTNGTNMDGENGSLGPYQIRELYWIDATEFDKSIGGKYEDCIDKVYSEKIIYAYAKRYESHALYDRDIETLARLHNGGLNFRSYPIDTGKYWEKIKNSLDNH